MEKIQVHSHLKPSKVPNIDLVIVRGVSRPTNQSCYFKTDENQPRFPPRQFPGEPPSNLFPLIRNERMVGFPEVFEIELQDISLHVHKRSISKTVNDIGKKKEKTTKHLVSSIKSSFCFSL